MSVPHKIAELLDWLQRVQALGALLWWVLPSGVLAYIAASRSEMSPLQSSVAAFGCGAIALITYSIWRMNRPVDLDIVASC